MYKPSVHWQKITEVLPEPNTECLVWTGHYMFVATADFYDEETRQQYIALSNDVRLTNNNPKVIDHMRNCKGRFVEFGQNTYFDDDKVYWSVVPLAPGEQNPPPPDPFEDMVSRDVYLTKDGQIVGIHAIGYENPENPAEFMQMEIFGNEYNNEHEMLGRGSFRVFDSLESEVMNWELDGWVRREAPKKKGT